MQHIAMDIFATFGHLFYINDSERNTLEKWKWSQGHDRSLSEIPETRNNQ